MDNESNISLESTSDEGSPSEWKQYVEQRMNKGSEKDLSGVQEAFLKFTDTLEKSGLYKGSELKVFNDVVQRGRTDPITEKDLSDRELKGLSDMIRKDAWYKGKTVGNIDYPDYNTYQTSFWGPDVSHNLLGGFKYSINEDGSIDIDDKYDFNVDRGGPSDDNKFYQALAFISNPRGLAATIGRRMVPDQSKKGVPVAIHIPGE